MGKAILKPDLILSLNQICERNHQKGRERERKREREREIITAFASFYIIALLRKKIEN